MKGNIIFKTKQLKILLALRDPSQSWYIATLAKACDTTYVHACNFVGVCESMGITKSEKHGKIKLIKLTEKGSRIADMLASVNSILNIQEEKKTEAAKS